jgi:hypothetical protein
LDTAGKPIAEIAYVTPRFPDGIRGSDLAGLGEAIQRETMAVWYLANFTPATGTYFGFGESQSKEGPALPGTGPFNTLALASSLRIGGFGNRFFYGGRAPDLLQAEFGEIVTPSAISAVAAVFEGFWEWKLAKPTIPHATVEDAKVAIIEALNRFVMQVRAIAPEYGGIGHNGPPDEDLVTQEEEAILFKADSDLRIALSSSTDPANIEAAWSPVAEISAKLGHWALKQIDNFFTNFSAAAGKSFGQMSPYILLAALDVYFEGAHIADLISMLLKVIQEH